jgi:hypothetical protein
MAATKNRPLPIQITPGEPSDHRPALLWEGITIIENNPGIDMT